jgi:hypothetical protein
MAADHCGMYVVCDILQKAKPTGASTAKAEVQTKGKSKSGLLSKSNPLLSGKKAEMAARLLAGWERACCF